MPTLFQINVTANSGSTGYIAENIGDVAIRAGWKSYIAYGRDMRKSNSTLIKIGNKLDVYFHVLLTRIFDRHSFGSYFATKKLIKVIDEKSPDIIQLHNVHGYYINLPLILKYIAIKNIPLVWTLHDCWALTGHCSHFSLAECNKWQKECGSCPLRRSYPQSLFLDASRRNYRKKKDLISAVNNISIITPSNWLADIVRLSHLQNRFIYVIPNGVDTKIYFPRNNGANLRAKHGLEGKFVIMAAGTSWLPYKGLEDYGRLRQILPDEFAIILVGLSKEDFAKLPKGVIGVPRTKSQEELAEYYSMADCVMSLSRLESFGLTPVEGFACGTPAIVYDNVALSELVTEDVGFKVPVGNIEVLKDKCLQLYKVGKSYYSDKCRRLAVEKYDKDKCFLQYVDLYESLLNNK